MIYTREIHIQGLLKIFSLRKPCHKCPATIMAHHYNLCRLPSKWEDWENHTPVYSPVCTICWEFIVGKDGNRWERCPCYNHHGDKAAKLTWLTLEAEGCV
ncbi:MAG TPA: hypothetical protein VMW91_07690 [Desulfosporosinus sp.]|nr:hypothetical protein [Desulfosporosinus sp.]